MLKAPHILSRFHFSKVKSCFTFKCFVICSRYLKKKEGRHEYKKTDKTRTMTLGDCGIKRELRGWRVWCRSRYGTIQPRPLVYCKKLRERGINQQGLCYVANSFSSLSFPVNIDTGQSLYSYRFPFCKQQP